MNITIIGAGYVGYTIGVLLSKHHKVTMVDNDPRKVSLIMNDQTPVESTGVDIYRQTNNIKLIATPNLNQGCRFADLIIIALPTNTKPFSDELDTEGITNTIKEIHSYNQNALMVIKSTVPVGYTTDLIKKTGIDSIIYCPEFLRENSSILDCIYPDRIIIGEDSDRAKKLVEEVFLSYVKNKDTPVIYTSPDEAEAIKLFSNTYLAMRVAFFNELDTFSKIKGLDTNKIITGVCKDKRIGDYYNNPSFNYSGVCLPKDSRQLLSDFNHIPNKLITAIVESNTTRIDFIINRLNVNDTSVIGIYSNVTRLHNRSSSLRDLINKLHDKVSDLMIHTPDCKYRYNSVDGSIKIDNAITLNDLVGTCSVIVTDSITPELDSVRDKVITYTSNRFNN